MKKIFVLVFSLLCLFLIYKCFDKNKINYVSINDYSIYSNLSNYNEYIKDYLDKNNRLGTFNTSFINKNILSIYKDLLNNKTIKMDSNDYYFKKVLRESDFVVINIGMEELSYNYNKLDMNQNYQYFAKMYSNILKLVSEIRKYAKGKVLFLGYYNPTNYYDARVDEFFCDMDIKLNDLMINNNIIYIDLYELVKSNNYKKGNFIDINMHLKITNIIKYYME